MVHSWVFRNRGRLRWIYGPPLAGPVEETPAPPAQRTRPGAGKCARAGEVERRPKAVVLHPMPRRAG